MLSTNIVKLI